MTLVNVGLEAEEKVKVLRWHGSARIKLGPHSDVIIYGDSTDLAPLFSIADKDDALSALRNYVHDQYVTEQRAGYEGEKEQALLTLIDSVL